jgi:hypothetical protein
MCRPVFGEMPLGVYNFFSCSLGLLIQIKFLLAVLQQLVDFQISTVVETDANPFKRVSTTLLKHFKSYLLPSCK